jgi:hypothetical protein
MAMKLLIVLFFLLPAVALFAQKDTRKTKYFLLPESGDSISVNIWRGETVERVATYAGSIDKSTTDGQRYMAVMNYENKLTIHDIKNKTILSDTLSQNFEVHSMFLQGNYLYLGGRNIGYFKTIDMLKSYNIMRRYWTDVPIPKEVQKENKAVDDIVLVGDTLIAVDDLAFPKYLIYYKLDRKGAARLLGYVELGNNRPYESIHAARYDGKYLLLHSTSFSVDMGASTHFTLINKEELHDYFKQYLCASYFYWGYYYSDSYYNKQKWQKKEVICYGNSSNQDNFLFKSVIDFALLRDKMLFCHDTLGIAVVSVRTSERIVAQDFSLPSSLPKGILILKMTLTPNPNKILLSVRDEAYKIRHELVEVK